MADAPASQDGKMMLTITHSKGAAADVKVAVKKVSQLRKVFQAAADRFRTTPDALVFKFNGTILEGDHTPKMHEIPEGGIITAYPIEPDEDLATQNTSTQMNMDEGGDFAKDAEESTQSKITLVFRSQEGPSFSIKVSRTKPLRAAFDKAHEQFNKAPGTFRFVHNGIRVRDEDTPKMHEMEDKDEIDANIQQVGGAIIA